MRNEVLEPLLAGNSASWHPFDFKTGIGLSQQTITAEPSDIILLDGAYSSRHELTDLIDISILVEAERVVRKKRLVKREGTTFMDSWHRVWDLAEDYYFIHIRPKESFDFVVKN